MDLNAVNDILKNVLELTKELGLVGGLFVFFFISAHFWIWKLYNDRLKDRQKEIDKLAEENREYREMFLNLLKDHFKKMEGE